MGCSSSIPLSGQQPRLEPAVDPSPLKEGPNGLQVKVPENIEGSQESKEETSNADRAKRRHSMPNATEDGQEKEGKGYFIDAGRSSGAWRQLSLNDTASTGKGAISSATLESAESGDCLLDTVDDEELVEVEDDKAGGLMASLHKGNSDMESLMESPLNRGASTRQLKENSFNGSDDGDGSQASFLMDSTRGPFMPEGLNSSRSGAGHKSAGIVRDCPLAAELVEAGLDNLVAVLVERLGLWTPMEVLNLEDSTDWMDQPLTEEEKEAIARAKELFSGCRDANKHRVLAPYELDETLREVLSCRGMDVLEPELTELCGGTVEDLTKLQAEDIQRLKGCSPAMGGRLRQLCASVVEAVARREELRAILCTEDGCQALQDMLDAGGEVDLHGLEVNGPILSINMPGTKLANGFLGLARGIVVCGESATLQDVTLLSTRTGVTVEAASCSVINCLISSQRLNGMEVTGNCTSASMVGTTLANCKKSGLLVTDGAQVMMSECVVKLSKQLDGICVNGGGSRLTAKNCLVHSNAEVGVMAYNEGSVEMEDCKVWDCQEKHGIYIKGVGASATLKGCNVYDCGVSCLVAANGAAANVSDCEFTGAKDKYGVAITGILSLVALKGCVIASNAKVGIFVGDGGRVEASECEISGSRQYDGVSIRGTGSTARIEACKIFDNQEVGVYINGGAFAEIKDCEVSASREYHGIYCRGEGTSAALADCKVFNTQAIGVLAMDGGELEAINCEVFASREKHGVSAQGKGSSVFMKGGKVTDCFLTGVLAVDGGSVELQKVAISGKSQTDGVAVCGKWSRCRLDHCSIIGVVKVGVFATEGGNAEIVDSEVRSSQQLYGVYVKGSGSIAKLTRSRVVDCRELGIFVAEGAELSLGEGCEVSGTMVYHGIYVRGAGSMAEIVGDVNHPVTVRDCMSSGMVVAESATAVIRHATITGSRRLHGIEVTGAKSEISISGCQIHSCTQVGAVAAQGATLHMEDTEVRDSLKLHAVCVKGSGSRARLTGLKLHDCASNGLFVYDGAVADVENCEIFSSLESNGCQAKGQGTRLSMRSCNIYDNALSGIYCINGARVEVAASSIYGSRRFHGVEVQGESAEAQVSGCSIYNHSQNCVFANDGGNITVFECKIYGSNKLSGASAKGKASFITLASTKLYDCNQAGVLASRMGHVTATKCELFGCKGPGAWALAEGAVALSDCRIYENRQPIGTGDNGKLDTDESCQIADVIGSQPEDKETGE